jgi:hypothetical protein
MNTDFTVRVSVFIREIRGNYFFINSSTAEVIALGFGHG